jgi:hypothetical protein
MCLHYGYDDAVWELGEQYLVGTQLLVAPVLHEGATSVEVYFPHLSGSWVHIVSLCHRVCSCRRRLAVLLRCCVAFRRHALSTS